MNIKPLLERMIVSKFKIHRKEKDGENLRLIGDGTKAKFILTNFPDDTITIKLPNDHKGFLSGDKKSLTSMCDYLIVIPEKHAKMKIIFCELKKVVRVDVEYDVDRASEQIRSSIPLFKYIRSAINIHCKIRPRIEMKDIYYVIIGRYRHERAEGRKGSPHRENHVKLRYRKDGKDFSVITGSLHISPKDVNVNEGTRKLPLRNP